MEPNDEFFKCFKFLIQLFHRQDRQLHLHDRAGVPPLGPLGDLRAGARRGGGMGHHREETANYVTR